jgi:hypothetical protein
MTPTRYLAGCLVSILVLGGCARTGYAPVLQDSARPTTSAPNCGKTLKLKESCLALVRASEWYSATGLVVSPGETYRMSVPENQLWFDKGRPNSPPQGEQGNWLMNRFERRHPESLWFALMAAVVSKQDGQNLSTSVAIDSYDISTNREVKVASAGLLVMYPNDAAWLSREKEIFYHNNSGQIWVFIECVAMCANPQ